MKLRGWISVGLLLVSCAFAFAAFAAPAKPAKAVAAPVAAAVAPIDPATLPLDERGWLRDTTLLARVQDRDIRVRRYQEAYFASYAEFRPRGDSAGKQEFLTNMVNKEVMGLVAAQAARPLDFADRVKMRETTQRIMSTVLFQRAVLDSVTVTEEEVRNMYATYQYEVRARHILLDDKMTAEKVRQQLADRKITFDDAVRRYSKAADKSTGGYLGWAYRGGMDQDLADRVYELPIGQVSDVIRDSQGYHLVVIAERKPVAAPAYNAIRNSIERLIREFRISQRAGRLQSEARNAIAMTYDTTNIVWASSHFKPNQSLRSEGGESVIELDATVPEFAPEDTSKVLARFDGGQFSLGQFIHSYTDVNPIMRPSINDFESFRIQVDGMVLEPQMAIIAQRRGLDRDPMAVELIGNQLEQIRVEHLYSDSIESKVWVRSEERKKYYKEHEHELATYPKARYAQFVRPTKAEAEELMARLKSGENAQDIVTADSLLGVGRSVIEERDGRDHGSAFYRVIFEELKPGQMSIDGPDRLGQFQVVQLLNYEASRQLSYQEAEHVVDESLQNIKAEEALKTFLARHRKQYAIVERTELLRWVEMIDPTIPR